MRVLHVTRDFPPRCTGGISTAVGGMVRGCVDAGMTCAVISFDGWRPAARTRAQSKPKTKSTPTPPGSPAEASEVPVLRLSDASGLPDAHAFADRVSPEIVHVHHGMLWSFAAQVRERLGIPAILHAHVLQAEQSRLRGLERETLSEKAQREAATEADGVLVPSRFAARLLRDACPGSARIEATGLGIADGEEARRAAQARGADTPGVDTPGVDTPSTDGPILYVGRFADINGTGEFLAAIPRLLERVPEARFAIAGGIPENPRAEARWRARFLEKTRPEVAERVTFLGWLSRSALSERYARARFLVSPSWIETFGLVVLEAMLHGVPVLATRSGGVEELIRDRVTGRLCAARDVDALVDGMVDLYRAPARDALMLGRAAADSARSDHSWERVVPRLSAFYQSCLESARAADCRT